MKLEDIIFEDSYIESFVFDGNSLKMRILAAIYSDSIFYTPPKPNEARCYIHMDLKFEEIFNFTVKTMRFMPTAYKDEVDFGSPDFIGKNDDGIWEVYGDMGSYTFETKKDLIITRVEKNT